MDIVESTRTEVITEKKYIAFDGTEFKSQEACERYEKRLKAEERPVWRNRIMNVELFNVNVNATLFFIASQDDYNLVLDMLEPEKLSEDLDTFEKCGVGWYIHSRVQYNFTNYVDCICKLDNYIEGMSRRWENWKIDVLLKIDAKLRGSNKK